MTLRRRPSFYTFFANYRFGLLFLSLLLTLGGSAVLSELRVARALNVLILLNLLMLLGVASQPWTLRAGLGLFAVSLVSAALSTLTVETASLPVGQISAVILLMLGTLGCFRRAFSPGPVDRERLASALSLYLLFGLIFALVFAVIAELLPGSFHSGRGGAGLPRPEALDPHVDPEHGPHGEIFLGSVDSGIQREDLESETLSQEFLGTNDFVGTALKLMQVRKLYDTPVQIIMLFRMAR